MANELANDALLRTTAELEAACARCREEGVAALDTEFVWRRTYRPQLGLVQLGCRSACWALDCLTGMHTEPLKALLEDASVVKILHAASQDLSHLHHWTGAVPRTVFDTQWSAGFAGFPANVGLQKVLFDVLDVGLPKTETCTNWMQRPLSPAQVRYSLDDVRYLPALRDELLRRARELGTADWLDEECRRLDGERVYGDAASDLMWMRIKLNRTRLDGRGRAVLRAVAALREDTARAWNLPRAWLGEDGSLVEMAVAGRVTKLVHRLRGGQGDTLRALYARAIDEALALPGEAWPEDPNRRYIAEVTSAAGRAYDWLVEKAEELHVDVRVLASRATVTAFVDDVADETNLLARGWRWTAVGSEMAERFGVE